MTRPSQPVFLGICSVCRNRVWSADQADIERQGTRNVWVHRECKKGSDQ